MNNKLTISLVVAALLVAGIVYYAFSHKQTVSDSTETNTNTEQTTTDSTDPNSFSSIEEAMSKGLTLKCTYNDDSNQATVAYVKSGQVRTIIQNPTSKTSPDNFLLIDKQLYMWSSGSKQGFTLTIDDTTPPANANEDLDKATNTDLVGALDTHKNNCSTATVDDSNFIKPAGVTFQDFSTLYQTK